MVNSNESLPFAKQAWLIGFLMLNIAIYTAMTCSILGGPALFVRWLETHWEILFVLCLAMVVTLIIGNQVNWRRKAVLVFWNWSEPLPVTRAFSRYLRSKIAEDPGAHDGIVDQPRMNSTQQEALWLQIYNAYRTDPAVIEMRNDFLFAQELAWLAFVSLLFLGVGSLITGPSTVHLLGYLAFLLIQYIVASIVARSKGIRFCRNVLAVAQTHKIL